MKKLAIKLHKVDGVITVTVDAHIASAAHAGYTASSTKCSSCQTINIFMDVVYLFATALITIHMYVHTVLGLGQ